MMTDEAGSYWQILLLKLMKEGCFWMVMGGGGGGGVVGWDDAALGRKDG